MNATLNSILADLDSIGLDELNKRAAMLTRVDRKYALDAATASAILSRLPEGVLVLNIDGQVSQGYASTYYDTQGTPTDGSTGNPPQMIDQPGRIPRIGVEFVV